MKLSELAEAVKGAQAYCKQNKIKDPRVIVDLDEEGGYYDMETLVAEVIEDDEGEEIVINIKSSNEM